MKVNQRFDEDSVYPSKVEQKHSILIEVGILPSKRFQKIKRRIYCKDFGYHGKKITLGLLNLENDHCLLNVKSFVFFFFFNP